MPDKFHNPYSFIPPANPALAGDYKCGDPDAYPLGKGRPAGHDRYQPDLWSGRIGIEIEAATPLLIPDAVAEVKTVDGQEHKIYQTRRGSDGRPILPVTTFKGALRSAYEAITNSRLGVFRGHGAPLARRMDAREGLAVVPARVVGKNGQKSIELWLGNRRDLPGEPQKEKYPPLYAAWLPMWREGYGRSFVNDLQHGDEVYCRIQRVQHTAWRHGAHQRDFDFWEVVAARRVDGPGSLDRSVSASHVNLESQDRRSIYSPIGEPMGVRGFVVATNQNFGRKHDERVFFVPDSGAGGPLPVPLSDMEFDRLATRWSQLIEDSRTLHQVAVDARERTGGAPDRFLGRNPGQTAFSRHTYKREERTLVPGEPFDRDSQGPHRYGTVCYALLAKSPNGEPRKRNGFPIVEAHFPVMIGRELGHWSPFDMLEPTLRPAMHFRELSPADRVFGWVGDKTANQSGTKDKTEADTDTLPSAWKGQLRIAPIQCDGVKDEGGNDAKEADGEPLTPIQPFPNGEVLPLAILSTPKSSQARFYAARDRVGRPFRPVDDIKRSGYFEARNSNIAGAQPQSGLRGRKVYSKHAAASRFKDYWSPARALEDAGNAGPPDAVSANGPQLFREYVRRAETPNTPKQDSQNRSIRDWVRPGTQFSTHIDVMNLNTAELGALLWLLDLGQTATAGGEPTTAHLRLARIMHQA